MTTDSGEAEIWDVVIVGGGAAGVFAAIACADSRPDRSVLVLERGPEPLVKVRVSGGGRCNVTHACFEPSELVRHYPRGGRELLGPFHSWQAKDTVGWFEQRGVPLKAEADGRMFPVTDSSSTIVECLLSRARDAGVALRLRSGLLDAEQTAAGRFRLRVPPDGSIECSRLLLATGGLRAGPVMRVLRKFGHSIQPLAPSLFTFHVNDPLLRGLPGVAVEFAEVSIPETRFRQAGAVLITHWGLSGPAILKLSAWAARWTHERSYRFPCRVNWVAPRDFEEIRRELDRLRVDRARYLVRKITAFGLPQRLWERLVQRAQIGEATQWNQLRRDEARRLAELLTRSELTVDGKSMFKEEFVTCGGVSLREVHCKTMESRFIPGLHFAGELLDIDGVTGGFNFQAAWTTGMLAGRALAAAEDPATRRPKETRG